MKPINILLAMLVAVSLADIVRPSLALSIPICFLISAVVIIFYFDLEDFRKIKAVEKRLEELESSLRSLKSSMNLKNL